MGVDDVGGEMEVMLVGLGEGGGVLSPKYDM